MPPLDWQQILSQALSFFILLWLLRRFAWTPLLSMLDQRRQRIQQDLQEASQAKTDALKLEQDLAARLAKIDEETRTKIQQAILEAKRISLEVQEQARVQARGILEKSKETIELELAKAKVTLRDQLAEMTAVAVERILHEKLDAQADRRLIERIIDELEGSSRT